MRDGMSHPYGLILAGGRGTRFWPRSRRTRAKQVLNFFGERSLIQQTVDRLRPVIPPERIWILTNHHLRAEIVKQLPDVPEAPDPGRARAAQHRARDRPGRAHSAIARSRRGDGRLPADHVIAKPRDYVRLLRPAFKPRRRQHRGAGHSAALGRDRLRLRRISQGREAGARSRCSVSQLPRETRCGHRAKSFVEAGNFYWNAGMFFWKTSVLLDALRAFSAARPRSCSPACRLSPAASFAAKPAPTCSRSAKTSRSTTRCWRRAVERGRHPRRRYRLERRRQLERGLRTAAARRRRQRAARRCAHRSEHRQLRRRRRQSWWRCWA